jgi:aspartate racemase
MTAAGTPPRVRVIGMLGGMSWESSAQYYRLVNELARERLGGLHSARLVLVSVDFAEIEQLQVTGQWEEAGELLAEAAKSAEAAGATGGGPGPGPPRDLFRTLPRRGP